MGIQQWNGASKLSDGWQPLANGLRDGTYSFLRKHLAKLSTAQDAKCCGAWKSSWTAPSRSLRRWDHLSTGDASKGLLLYLMAVGSEALAISEQSVLLVVYTLPSNRVSGALCMFASIRLLAAALWPT